MTLDWAPDACTLPTAARPLRIAEFDDLFATSLLEVEHRSTTRLRMVLEGRGGLEQEVRDLTDRETDCCSFFIFTISQIDGQAAGTVRLRLDIEVPPEHSCVLRAVAERAEATRTVDP